MESKLKQLNLQYGTKTESAVIMQSNARF